MKKLAYVIAALGALAIVAPTMASAETVVIKRGGYHGYHGSHGARAEFRPHRDRGWHRGHHRDRIVVIKRNHRNWR